jgi:hypothetical protein
MCREIYAAVVAVACLSMAPANRVAQESAREGGWRASALVAPVAPDAPNVPLTVWGGLKNVTQVARLVCFAGWSITVRTPKMNETDSEGVSPHACGVLSSYVVILPGETLFRPFSFDPRRAKPESTSRLDVTLTVIEWTSGKRPGLKDSVAVRWSGSIEEARSAASRTAIAWR